MLTLPKRKKKKREDFLLQRAFNKRLKFLSWLNEESPNPKDRSLWSVAPGGSLVIELRQEL